MDARGAIRCGLEMAEFISLGYLEDLSESDLFHRPASGANHINWQVGHLIVSEHDIIEGCLPGSSPALPTGFAERYGKLTASSDERSQFCSKGDLIAAYRAQRVATLAALDKLSDVDLDTVSPEPIGSYAPTWGAAISMQGSHWLMHAGQWAVIRRQLGRAPLF